MQKIAIGFLLIITVAFGALYFAEKGETKASRANLTALEDKLKNRDLELKNYESSVEKIKDEKEAAVKESENLKVEIAEIKKRAVQEKEESKETMPEVVSEVQPAVVAKTEGAEGEKTREGMKGFGEMIEKMMKDPEMRKAMREQQKTLLGMLYGDLFSELGLNEEDLEKFKDLLIDRQLSGMETGMAFMSGESDSAKRQEMVNKMKQERENADARLKEFLGNERFANFQEYEKTVPDRSAMVPFKQQLAASNSVLDRNQERQLMQAMKEERESFKFTVNFSDPNRMNYDFSQISEENLNTYVQEQGQLNARVLERARLILPAEQVAQFKVFQENQLKMMRMGMTMARGMFAPNEEKK